MATYETAPDQHVDIGHARLAYRRLGASSGIPLVFCMHFRGTMDHWDPALINPIAAVHPVILFDSAGVGRSSGAVPTTYAGWAACVAVLARTLDLPQIDLLGFSMGGCCAQLVALNHPGLVRRLILAGTTPSAGPGVRILAGPDELAPFNLLRWARTADEQRAAFLAGFFRDTPAGRAAGRAAWGRIEGSRNGARTGLLGAEGAKRQGIAFVNFNDPQQAGEASYARLGDIKIPVLVANGSHDALLPTENSYLIYKMLGNAHLHLYPDSGHGFLYQHAGHFADLVNQFLDMPAVETSRL